MTEAELDLPTQPRLAPLASRRIQCAECGKYICAMDLNECKPGSSVRITVRMRCPNKRCLFIVEFDIVARE